MLSVPPFERRVPGAAGAPQRAVRSAAPRPTCGRRRSAAPPGVIQLVRADGTLSGPSRGGARSPWTSACGGGGRDGRTYLTDKDVDGSHLRVLVQQAPEPASRC